MKHTHKALIASLAFSAFCGIGIPFPSLASSAFAAENVSTTKQYKTLEVPVLSVQGDEGRFSRLSFEFERDGRKSTPLRVRIGDDVSGGSGDEIRASIWSAAVVAAQLRHDMLAGARISIDFSGFVDGPSAGGVICLAILSALDGRDFPADFAMTGTILPDGSIGVVGGVEQKMNAAAKAGIKRVCIPAAGRMEKTRGEDGVLVLDLVKHGKRLGLDVILVDTVEEAYCAAHKIPLEPKAILPERELLRGTPELEKVWDDAAFRERNYIGRVLYWLDKVRGGRDFSDEWKLQVRLDNLHAAGFLPVLSPLISKVLPVARAWDNFLKEQDAFLAQGDNHKILLNLIKHSDEVATEEDKKFIENYAAFIRDSAEHVTAIDLSGKRQFSFGAEDRKSDYAPWLTEICAQLEPVDVYANIRAVLDQAGWRLKNENALLKTKGDVAVQFYLWTTIAVSTARTLCCVNETRLLDQEQKLLPPARANANVATARRFFNAARKSVERSVSVDIQNISTSKLKKNLFLSKFLFGCQDSESFFAPALNGEKEEHLAYRAMENILFDCKLLAKGAATKIFYSPDIGGVERSDNGAFIYEKIHVLNAMIRTARIQALENIKICRERNIPCLAAVRAFLEADTSRGDDTRDQLYDVLAKYWEAGNIASALALCFDPQPTVESAALGGNASAQYIAGARAWAEGDIERAKQFFEKSAAQGDARAQYELAQLLLETNKEEAIRLMAAAAEQGYNYANEFLGDWYSHFNRDDILPLDKKKAFAFYKKAAETGSLHAQERLAWFYLNEGRSGFEENPTLGLPWLKLAAERDDALAQYYLAEDYDRGLHAVEKDELQAVRWYYRSALNENSDAQCNLGLCYEFGKGVEKDLGEAFKWYNRSAEQGNSYGQFNLGDCYEYGKGIEKDLGLARAWYEKSAAQGNEAAKKRLEDLE